MEKRKQLVYRFEEGDASMRDLLGGKGANLCEMSKLGLPVPPGIIITTEACLDYYRRGHQLPTGLWEQILDGIKSIETSLGRQFGSDTNPLLVSVRSGARVSMPGMMDTILNLGINDHLVPGLANLMGDERPAYDAYRRFLQAYGSVVMGIEDSAFENILAHHKANAGITLDYELNPESLLHIIVDFKAAITKATGKAVPEEPEEQLIGAIEAVFRSWNSPRAIAYRNHFSLSHDWGTGVSIVAMVFGNLGNDSGTGVLFTRDPSNGTNDIYGEYLVNGQGEDVVAGIRNPEPLSSLARQNPDVYEQLSTMAQRLEQHYRDVQDMEFTVEKGRLFLLQTRTAQRTVQAAVKTAVDMADEGLITQHEALTRVKAEDITLLFVPQFDAASKSKAESGSVFLGKGFGASPGAASGKAYFDATRASLASLDGTPVILIRPETRPEDIHGILGAKGVLTSKGGVTSHAAVVTRGLGVPCIAGCEELQIDLERKLVYANGHTVKEGENISIDGTTGEAFVGEMETVQPNLDELGEAQTLLSWADKTRRLGVWANADTPADAKKAIEMGAQGIGLCRTEHMFLGPERVPVVQKLLLNASIAERWEQANTDKEYLREPSPNLPEEVSEFYRCLSELKQLQIDDFTGILRVMGDRPVIIRLLDTPLHEFLPKYEDLIRDLLILKNEGASAEQIARSEQSLQLVESVKEQNPMLGHRGCRLGITFPAIYEMQVEAIMTASVHLSGEGLKVRPEIMIPLISHVNELRLLRDRLTEVAKRVQAESGSVVKYLFGTMIETPRAALTGHELADVSEFFSFGTNDLTQTTYGFSRDDAESKFLNKYIDQQILSDNPFATLDTEGIGALIRTAVKGGRQTRPQLEVGICGEHGGDPASIAFCHMAGLDYVSCSPYRVPVARLAAAQAAIAHDTPDIPK